MLYFDLIKMRRFMIFSVLSSLIMIFTLGFYSLSPFIFHSMGFNAVVNGVMCIPYALGLVSGAYALSTVFYHLDSEKTLSYSILFYFIFFVVMSLLTIFYVNLWVIGFFACIVGATCGLAASLSLSLCMQGFHENRGAASAVQAFVRYFFAGVGLLGCNFIELTHFYQLSFIFLVVSVVMIILNGFECKKHR